jgi:hypothetical protein
MISTTAQLEQKISRIRREYGEEMSAKDIAREEKCSPSKASRRMANFEFGGLTKRNARVVRCYREGYIQFLRDKTVLQRGAA